MNVQSLLEGANPYKKQQDDSQRLVTKWKKYGLLEGLKDSTEATNMAILLENQTKQMISESNITGGTNSMSGGTYNSENWAGVALPLVRRVFGEIAAKEFVSVQPMNLPSGLVFYLDFKYGSSRKPFAAASSIYSADATTNVTDLTGGLYGAGRFGYSINNASASAVAFTVATASWADVNFDSTYSASVVAGTVKKVTFATSSLTDLDANAIRAFIPVSGSNLDTANILQAFTSLTSAGNIVFYVTGSTANISGSTATVHYLKQTRPEARGDFEDGSATAQTQPLDIPSIDVKLKSESIVAKTRKLKAQWTPEFAQDLNAYHSIDAEAELTGMLSQYISMEIDLELLDMLIENAYSVDYWSANNNQFINAGGTAFDQQSAGTGGYYNSQGQWFQTLGTKLQKVSNKIHQLTLRGGANFMVCSPTVATIIESIPGFASDSNGDKMEFNFGVQKVGSLNSRYKVYKNPYMTENVILMGFKGSQFLECGAVFAPYVPLIMTPLLYDPTTFTPRKGLMTRYAKKMVRPDYFGKIFVSGLNTL